MGEEEKDGETAQEIVLKVYMHCESCARKVERSLRGFEGVMEVKADSRAQTVLVKGKTVDPIKICERVQRKTGRKVELISPSLNPPDDEVKEEPKEEEKDEPPSAITVVLKVRMHCEACAHVLQRKIKKMDGVESVETDARNDQVIVRGIVDPETIVRKINRETRRRATIAVEEETKESPEGEKVDEVKEGDFSEVELYKYEFLLPSYSIQSTYPQQFFSDENPSACSVM